jgi:hypothetical protein
MLELVSQCQLYFEEDRADTNTKNTGVRAFHSMQTTHCPRQNPPTRILRSSTLFYHFTVGNLLIPLQLERLLKDF